MKLKNRFVEGASEAIEKVLKWAGLEYDEGPSVGGSCAPYFQSERTQLYKKHAEELVEKGGAYRCFCSAERLEKLKEMRSRKGVASNYDRLCFYLPKEEVNKRLLSGEKHTIRMLIPSSGSTLVNDMVLPPQFIQISFLSNLQSNQSFFSFNLSFSLTQKECFFFF